MFRTTHIRTKLVAALAVPLVALVAVASFEVVSAMRAVDATWSQTDLAASSVGPGSLVGRLQDERNRAAIDLMGLGAAAGLPVATNAEARGLVDEAIPALRDELAGRQSAVAAAFAPALTALDGLAQIRTDIDAYTGPLDTSNHQLADAVFGRYTDIIEAFFDATSTVAVQMDDADLRNGVALIDASARQSEVRARLVRRIVLAAVTGTADAAAALQDVAAMRDRSVALDDEIRANATGPYQGIAEATLAEPEIQQFNAQVDAFLAGGAVDIDAVLTAVRSEPDIGYLGLRTRTIDALGAEARRIESAAVAQQRLFGGIALAALLLAGIVTWLASRSITRPLASLQQQAEAMAGTKLPAVVRRILDTAPGEDVVIPKLEPIQVRSRDEVAEVASALSAVQASAVDLAVEQAVLRRNISDSYINLGRRNQNLLSRQLDFITELERNETDPDTLEGLFRLDHLATRMRRNAESLLVLSGVEPPRQWSAPVKVGDVVRAALGEVEDYQRVVVRHLEPAAVNGAVAADIAHVLAELIENGLAFSPPEQTVEVRGRLDTNGYTVAVTDNGLGMVAEDLVRANRRLAGQESFTVAPSRYLGHYVAGHLASRLGVTVELQDSPAGGITARVDVPMGLLASEETDPRLVKLQVEAKAAESAALAAPVAPAAEVEAPAPRSPDVSPGVSDGARPPGAPAHAAKSRTANGLPRRGGAPPAHSIDLDAPTPLAATTEPEPAHVEPAREAAPEPAPEPTAEAQPPVVRGFGGLAVTRPQGESLYSAAARNARLAGDGPPGDDGRTRAGLPRRVPGAQRPDATLSGGRAPESEAHSWPGQPAGTTSPEDVYSFLSSFQSGVARGLAAAHADDTDTESMEDGR